MCSKTCEPFDATAYCNFNINEVFDTLEKYNDHSKGYR